MKLTQDMQWAKVGSLEKGQQITIQPQGTNAKLRGIQSHRNDTENALPGMRSALNLPEVGIRKGKAREGIRRGDVITSMENPRSREDAADNGRFVVRPAHGVARVLLTVERDKVEDVVYAGSTVEAWGIGLTATGGSAVILGLAIGLSGDGDWGSAIIGAFLLVGGAPLVLGGVPLWISGAVDKSDQRQLYEFDAKTGMFNTPTQPGTYKLTLRF